MNREETIAKLDLEDAKRNFDIETDAGRHDEPPVMEFDRLAICRKCIHFVITYGSLKIYKYCKKTMRNGAEQFKFCPESDDKAIELERN